MSTGKGTSGRTKALKILDQMLGTEQNQTILRQAMQTAFRKNPMQFFRTIVMPLLPKEARLGLESEGRVLWTRISEAYPAEEAEGETVDVVPLYCGGHR